MAINMQRIGTFQKVSQSYRERPLPKQKYSFFSLQMLIRWPILSKILAPNIQRKKCTKGSVLGISEILCALIMDKRIKQLCNFAKICIRRLRAPL